MRTERHSHVRGRSDRVDGGIANQHLARQLACDGPARIARENQEPARLTVGEQIDSTRVAYVGEGQTRHRLQRLLDVERGQQAARVGQKEGSPQQSLALRHVAIAPDAPHDLVADALRPRVALEEASIAEMERIEALGPRLALELVYASQAGFAILELIVDQRQEVFEALV